MVITRASNPSLEGVMGDFSATLVKRLLVIRTGKQARRPTLEKGREVF